MAFNLENRKNQATQTINRPRAGDMVEVFITGATEFGAFGHTGNGVYLGMIHRSEIADEMVADAREYFVVGEKVKAMVVGRRPDGKFNFSTKRLGGKARRVLSAPEKATGEPGGPSGSSLSAGGKFREAFRLPKAVSRSLRTINSGGGGTLPSDLGGRRPSIGTNRTVEPAGELIAAAELEKLLGKNLSSSLSAAAKNKLAEMCRLYGPVRLTVSMMEETSDPGLAILSWLEHTLRRGN